MSYADRSIKVYRRKNPPRNWTWDLAKAERLPQPSPEVLHGSVAIAEYAGVKWNVLLLWRRRYGFPVGKLPNGRWCTTKRLIEEWILACGEAELAAEQAARGTVFTNGEAKAQV